MGPIKEKHFGYIVSLTTGIIIGTLIATFLYTILISYRLDENYKNIVRLESIIQEKDAKLENLEKFINAQDMVLQDIEINLILPKEKIDELDIIDIEKVIKEKYNTLLGKEVRTIDSDILVEVVNKRILKIEKKEYRLYVERLILTETLELYIRVEMKE